MKLAPNVKLLPKDKGEDAVIFAGDDAYSHAEHYMQGGEARKRGDKIKANPNIDVSVDREKLASTIQKARGIPSQWVEMLTKRFNIWCQGATPWMG
ncbi:TPA: terminase TerL endonuclease subunit, partial [Escherichia coli]